MSPGAQTPRAAAPDASTRRRDLTATADASAIACSTIHLFMRAVPKRRTERNIAALLQLSPMRLAAPPFIHQLCEALHSL
jgi:hypothetical protein